MPPIKVSELVDQVSARLEPKFKALTPGLAKEEVSKLILEEMGNAERTKSLTDLITTAVLQKIPTAGAFSPASISAYDPEKGLKSLSKAALEMLKKQMSFIFTPEGRRAEQFSEADRKALNISAGADGLFLVPEEFKAEVLRKLVKLSTFRTQARNFNGVGLKGSIPRETGTVTIGYVAEDSSPANTQFALGQLVWGLNKRMSLTTMSRELFDFSAIDVLTLLATMFAEQNQKFDDQIFISGSGSNQPTGIRTIVTGQNTVAQAGVALKFTDLVELKHSLPVQYRAGAVFQMNNNNLAAVAKLRDDQNRPIFLDPFIGGIQAAGAPEQTVGILLGHPVMENVNIPDTEIRFDNLMRGYAIFDRGSMQTSTSDQVAFDTDQLRVKTVSYDDGKVSIAEALAFLSGVAE